MPGVLHCQPRVSLGIQTFALTCWILDRATGNENHHTRLVRVNSRRRAAGSLAELSHAVAGVGSGYTARVLDSRQIRMFHEVVRAGSYSAAARGLGYTQPAVSQQIRALERNVGTPLFTRVGRSLQLTEAGELLARHAVDILGGLAAAQQQVAEIKHLRAGRVRVCAFPSASATIVASAVAHLGATNPGIRVRLFEAEPPGSLDMLVAGECDIAVGFSYQEIPEPNSDRFTVVPLLDDEIRVVLPVGHPLARKRAVDLAQLSNETWIAGCPRCRAHFVSACEAAGFEPDIAFTTDDNLVVQSLVVAGVGVASMPGLVLSFMRHPQLVDRLLRPESRRSVAAYTLPEYERIPAIALMLEALQTVSATLKPHGSAPRQGIHP